MELLVMTAPGPLTTDRALGRSGPGSICGERSRNPLPSIPSIPRIDSLVLRLTVMEDRNGDVRTSLLLRWAPRRFETFPGGERSYR